METKIVPLEELMKSVSKLKEAANVYGSKAYEGFHFFAPADFLMTGVENYHCVLALESQELVGIILLFQDPEYPDSYSISYVDVKREFQRQGIARQLYCALNEWIQSTDCLVGTDLTDLGKAAKLNKVRNKLVTRCRTFDNFNQYKAFLTYQKR
jgi:GNAT superfamily N-acetyltransferase